MNGPAQKLVEAGISNWGGRWCETIYV